jgi:hypothetical protein
LGKIFEIDRENPQQTKNILDSGDNGPTFKILATPLSCLDLLVLLTIFCIMQPHGTLQGADMI